MCSTLMGMNRGTLGTGLVLHLAVFVMLLYGCFSNLWYAHSPTGCVEGLFIRCCPVPVGGVAESCTEANGVTVEQETAQVFAAIAVFLCFVTTAGHAIHLITLTESGPTGGARIAKGTFSFLGAGLAMSAWFMMWSVREEPLDDDSVEFRPATWVFMTAWIVWMLELFFAQCLVPNLPIGTRYGGFFVRSPFQ